VNEGPDPVEVVYDRITDAVFALDRDWRFTFLNDEAERLLRRSREDLLHKKVWAEFPEAVGSTFQDEYERAIEAQTPVAFEEYYPPLETWFEVRAYPSPSGLSVYFHDITDRVEHRQRLAGREEALRDAYAIVGDRERSASDKIQALLGVVRRTLETDVGMLSRTNLATGRHVVEAVAGDQPGPEPGDELDLAAAPCCRQVAQTGEPMALHHVREQAPDLSGGALDLEAYLGVPVRVDEETYGTFNFYSREPRKAPFTEWQGTFASLLADWTGNELEQEKRAQQMRRSNRRLATTTRRLERFARAASHDLKEPARTVASQLQLIEDRFGAALGEEGRELLGFAQQDARHMRDMVRGLLAYARIEGRETQRVPVDLESVVDDAWAGVEVPVREDLEVIVGQLPVVGGDPVQLRTLFTNLFENAIRYSDQAPRIETEAEAEGGRWRISVEDEGVGIPQAHHERVLDPFERLEPVSEGGGAGLGLAICQRIVDRHDGELEVASTPGEGSTFSFTLPPAPMEAPSEAELGPERGSLVL